MLNKLSFKITALFALVILIYILFIIFFAMPKIKQYVFNAEVRNAKSELQKVSSIVSSKSEVLKIFSEMTLQNHKDRIKDITQVSSNILKQYNNKYKSGKFSLQRAKELAFNEINTIRYGKNDYFYILNNAGVLVQHPDSRFLGKSLYDQADERGKMFAQELMRKSFEKGDAYTQYWWVKDKKDKILEKIAYTIYYKPWDIYLSSGVYIDDIQKELDIQKQNIIKSLNNLLSSMKILKTGYIFILSHDNKMIIHPHRELVNKDFSDVYDLNQRLEKAFKSNSEVKYSSSKTEEDKLAWVENNDFFGWYIVVNVPKSELYDAAREINYTFLSMTCIVLSFLFVLIAMSIKRLMLPIELLSQDALEIQKGNLSVRNTIKSDDELGVLAKQFNYMVSAIEDNVKNLEEKVLLRTEALNDKLYTDDLTKLKNKFALMEDLKDKESATLMVLDIESFDDINELYSYHVGNVVLVDYSKFLQRFCLNRSYELYRLFGNTYALRDKEELPNLNKYEADMAELVESTKKYKANIEELNLKLDIDVTLGAAIFQDHPLRKANIALKYAKRNQKRFFVYSTLLDENERIENIILWREKLKDAIENDKMVPFYQPILNRKQEIIKFETLMRMKKIEPNEEESYISPFVFLDVAVKTKQYARLSEIIIRKALFAALNEKYSISINLSFADIADPNIINMLDEFFNKNSPELCSRVVFEILESDHITDYEIFEDFIFKYRKLGLRFAIDDFGTGYSNFTHILAIRPDYIKIDGSLIKNIDTDNDSLELVKSIIRFCQELHIKTIAEFVHSEEVFNIIYKLGVDEFQGFYFSPPVKSIKQCKLLNK